jgi:hypothetical protein
MKTTGSYKAAGWLAGRIESGVKAACRSLQSIDVYMHKYPKFFSPRPWASNV